MTDEEHGAKKDMKEFMDDIEEDPEMRQNIRLYKNKNVVDDLEKQLAALTLNENVPKLAPIETAQEKGSIKVGTETRKVVTGSRKTKEGALSKQ